MPLTGLCWWLTDLRSIQDGIACDNKRAGIAGAISQGLRRSRYVGLSRTQLQHVSTAAAISAVRAARWLRGEAPEPTRVSPFLALTAA